MLNPLKEAGLAKMNEDGLPDRVITKSAKEVLLYTKGGLIASFLPAPVFASPMRAVLEASWDVEVPCLANYLLRILKFSPTIFWNKQKTRLLNC